MRICIIPTVAIFPLAQACIVNRASSILLSSNQSFLWPYSKVCGKEPSSGCEFLLCLLHPKSLYFFVNYHTQPLAICLKFQLNSYYWHVWHLASATGKSVLLSIFSLEILSFKFWVIWLSCSLKCLVDSIKDIILKINQLFWINIVVEIMLCPAFYNQAKARRDNGM